MAEIIVENQVCKTCGVNVRPQALFCYNCGSAISPNSSENGGKNGKSRIKDELFSGKQQREVVEKTPVPDAIDETQKPVSIEKAGSAEKKPDLIKDAKLKSAASLRNKAKSFQKKEIEIVWEEPEEKSGAAFALVALVIMVFAIVIVFLAIQLK
ncbi:MAG: hypothetical protein JWN60_2516 [Acidobacteria bacterium]|nr:hypothetical protein [Acidobacteriota bacterium]